MWHSKDKEMKHIVVSMARSKPNNKNTRDITYTFKPGDPVIHPELTKPGFIEFSQADLLSEDEIEAKQAKDDPKNKYRPKAVLGYKNTDMGQVKDILKEIPDSEAKLEVMKI